MVLEGDVKMFKWLVKKLSKESIYIPYVGNETEDQKGVILGFLKGTIADCGEAIYDSFGTGIVYWVQNSLPIPVDPDKDEVLPVVKVTSSYRPDILGNLDTLVILVKTEEIIKIGPFSYKYKVLGKGDQNQIGMFMCMQFMNGGYDVVNDRFLTKV